ncbi:unnamed protein product [Trichobilharzia regenti]|nr:unnamed protein product [Trichobilharzia regenti]
MCPNQLSGSTGEIRATISTFIHEMAHALGFSSTSYAFLRDENGNPRTPRDPQTDLPALGQDSDFIFIARYVKILSSFFLRQKPFLFTIWHKYSD